MILPYPVAYLEDGIMLFYFTGETAVGKKYGFTFNKDLNDILCFFGNFGVPVSLIKKLDFTRNQNTIYFMRYDLISSAADLIGSFKIDDQFVIEMKVQIKLQELQQSAEEVESPETV